MDFQLDLQLFGGGGGKRAVKTVLTVGAFFFGAGHVGMAMFGATSSLAGGLMGASLFSTIWAFGSARRNNLGDSSGMPSVVRFDRQQESMSMGGALPVVYGRRMITGNQTFHETDADANNLHKHVVLCEGGVEGLETVTANGYNIPQGTMKAGAVLTIQNVKHGDAWAEISAKTLHLYANGKMKTLSLKNETDMQSGNTYYAWQLEVGSLISYINRIGEGWEAFPLATTSRYCGDLSLEKTGCYKKPVPVTAASCVGVTSMSYHDGAVPENYAEVGGYPHMVWLDLRFTVSDNLNGNPNIEALVKGRKVYDTRYQEWAYSTNPAMCLRDLLLNKTYGGGEWLSADDIDEDSFKEAADWCDVIVRYKMADGTVREGKRYELNLVMDNSQSVWDWAQNIMASFCGYLVLSRNKLHLRIEKAESIAYVFDESSVHDLSVSQLSLDDCPNQYKVKFVDPLNNWKTATVIVDDASDQRERRKVVTKEVELEGVTSQAQVLRLARFYRDYNKTCTLQAEFKTGYEAIHLEPGDVIAITYKKVFYRALFRITEIRDSENGEYTIKGRQYNETIYNDSLGATVTAYNYSTVTPSVGKPLPPRNIQAQVMDDVLEYPITRLKAKVTWEESRTSRGITYHVYRKPYGSDGRWEFVGETTGTSYVVTEKQNVTVYYGVTAVSEAGVQSVMAESSSFNLSLYDKPPRAPQNMVITVTGADMLVSWDRNTEADFSHYEVSFRGETITTQENSVRLRGRDGRNEVKVYAYDLGGNCAYTVKSVVLTIKPADIAYVAVEKASGYVLLSWPESIGADYYTISGDANVTTFNNSVVIRVKQAGRYRYYVTACNDYDTSSSYTVTVDYSADEKSVGEVILTKNLLNNIRCGEDTKVVMEDGVKTVIKKLG